MYALLALVSLAVAIGSFYFYVKPNSGEEANTLYFVVAAVFLLLTLIFGGLFLSSRVNKTEDIHITE